MKRTSGKWIYPLTRKAIYLRDNNKCLYCNSTKNLSLDHIKTYKDGGTNKPTNLVTACLSCNRRRGSKNINTWLSSLYLSKSEINNIYIKLDKIQKTLPCDMRRLRNKVKNKKPWCLLAPNHSLLKG